MGEIIMLRYKVLTKGCEPTRGSIGDAGIDLVAAEKIFIYPGESAVIPLGIAMKIPEGMYGLLTHRSSLAFGEDCTASLGIIDSNFVGEIKAKVFNHNQSEPARIPKGSRVCQIIIQKYECIEMVADDDLGEGKGGFGSSGV